MYYTVLLIFRQIQCLHLMNSEVAWLLVSSGTQVQPQMILDPDYLPDYGKFEYSVTMPLFNLSSSSALKSCILNSL